MQLVIIDADETFPNVVLVIPEHVFTVLSCYFGTMVGMTSTVGPLQSL